MQLSQLTTITTKFKDELPKEVSRNLRDVQILVSPTVDSARLALAEIFAGDEETLKQIQLDIPAGCKGIFLGEPMECEVEGEEGEEEESLTLPEGVVVVVAENIADEKDAALVLLHETGHALGMSEDEVAALGLENGPTPKPALKTAPKAPVTVEAAPEPKPS
jgi:predicted Zn-dependent protease with MMP-like domain